MFLAVIGYPELSLADYYLIQAIRSRHDVDNYKFIKPHFTFVFPCQGITREKLLDHVEKCLDGVMSVSFKINKTQTNPDINGNEWYLFLVPDEGYDEIVNIHDTLYSGILSDKLRRDIPYTPHITVGVFGSKDECIKTSDNINQQNLAIRGEISKIDIIAIENNHVETIGTFKLLTAER
jgi:2'-5' RNA ligase